VLGVLLPATATAEPELRFQRIQRGGFMIVGSTQGQDCSASNVSLPDGSTSPIPLPLFGTPQCKEAFPGENALTQPGAADSALDLYWLNGKDATVASKETSPEAATTAVMLELPDGARVTYARLYWAGYVPRTDGNSTPSADPTVELLAPDAQVAVLVQAPKEEQFTVGRCDAGCDGSPSTQNDYFYQSSQDVTAFVRSSGRYSVRGIKSIPDATRENGEVISAWWLAVVYEDPKRPLELITLQDGFELLAPNEDSGPQKLTAQVSGFAWSVGTPRLGVVAYEGDSLEGGDYLAVNGTRQHDDLNSEWNFFNGTRSRDGEPATREEDRPRFSGGPRSLAGLDLDEVSLDAVPSEGLSVEVGSKGDLLLWSGLVSAIPVAAPDLTPRSLEVESVEEPPFRPGGEVEYTLSLENTGTDSATNLALSVPLPKELSFVGGSLTVETTTGTVEIPGDFGDEIVVNLAELLPDSRLAVGESVELVFRAKLAEELPACTPGTKCRISVQGALNFSSLSGSGSFGELTDGDGDASPEDVPTVFQVGGCTGDVDCEGSTPACVGGSCVACRTAEDCPAEAAICKSNACVACASNADCKNPAAPVCDNAVCVGCRTNADCKDPETPVCLDRLCVSAECRQDADCAAPNPRCIELICVPCRTRADCAADAPVCDAESHRCVCPPTDARCSGFRDDDRDGLTNDEEAALGTDPMDADSDEDGVMDGDEWDPGKDTDRDGVKNALDPDSDNDGLFDGTELGFGCSGRGTGVRFKRCIPDADAGATKTDPTDPDSDRGGVSDGSEDYNLNGRIDRGETNPNNPRDDKNVPDEDGDGVSDALEPRVGGNPSDADTDDDGVPDGKEPNAAFDSDGDGLPPLLDPDSDNDGLFDGTELGYGCSAAGTDTSRNRCRPDANPRTRTSPVDADTDDGGVTDGSEDFNLNGRIDAGETNPLDPRDDKRVVDTDSDGLSDGLEATLGSNPRDADTDDDGVLDGVEVNPSQDVDGDGLNAVLDVDLDGDNVLDGVELGTSCSHPDTSNLICIADGDLGATTTSVLLADTDGDGVVDGNVDSDRNGVIDDRDAVLVNGRIAGGGCGCAVPGTPARNAAHGAWALLGLGALLAVRRRRERSARSH
jgi:uncharacterized repeat protein (TIGR01451 family)/MYXO-CTERM domain-containing protein